MGIEIAENEIVFLTVSSWRGVSIGAQHYYGRLSLIEGSQSFDVVYKLSKEDAEHFNNFWSLEGSKELIGYEEGEETSRFRSEKKLITAAKRQFRKHFPNAKVLVLGDRGVVEPQPILVGPRQFKSEINKLAKRAKEIDYWEDNEEMQMLCAKWQQLWPVKYI